MTKSGSYLGRLSLYIMCLSFWLTNRVESFSNHGPASSDVSTGCWCGFGLRSLLLGPAVFVSVGYNGSLCSDGSGSVQRRLCVHLSGGASGGMKADWEPLDCRRTLKQMLLETLLHFLWPSLCGDSWISLELIREKGSECHYEISLPPGIINECK